MPASLGILDTVVLIASIAFAIFIGLRMSGKTQSVEAFLLGNRNLPWWAILGSIVATETSTATVLSVPGVGYGEPGMRFLQIAFGYLLGRAIVVYVLLPLFFQGKLFSAYEVLQRRFGDRLRYAASILFLVTRNLGDGLRLFLAAIVIEVLVGWPFVVSALAIGFVTILYTYFGGMRSVVWNDCIQLVIYMIGGVVSLFIIATAIPGGWEYFWQWASQNGRLVVLAPAPPDSFQADSWRFVSWLATDAYGLWGGLIGGAFLTLGTHGTDQMMVQRYLSARNQRDAGTAVMLSGVVVLLQFALFLFIGILLSCFYAAVPPEEAFERADRVYVHFIVNSFPQNTGLVGLMLAAILAAAMSTLSSSLNASASALLNDFYLPLKKEPTSAAQLLRLSRRFAIGFGIVQIAIGICAILLADTVVQNALTIAGYSAGLLLGLFLLAVFTKANETAAATGAGCGLLVLLAVQFLLPSAGISIAWVWFAMIGSTTTFACGSLVGLLPIGRSSENEIATESTTVTD